MKYSVSGRQPLEVLRKADEIKLDYRDKDKIFDYLIDFEEEPKEYVVVLGNAEEIVWDELVKINELSNNKLTVAIRILQNAEILNDLGIKWYWEYAITTYYELDTVMNFNPTYLLLGAPLYFDLPEVKKRNVPIRLVANMCYENMLPHKTGATGTYVRPEDVPAYEKYVDILEFVTFGNLKKEHTLLGVYLSGHWPGNLNLLLTNLGEHVDNRAVPEQFGEARIQCRQSCMRNSHCRLCENLIKFAQVVDKNRDKIK